MEPANSILKACYLTPKLNIWLGVLQPELQCERGQYPRPQFTIHHFFIPGRVIQIPAGSQPNVCWGRCCGNGLGVEGRAVATVSGTPAHHHQSQSDLSVVVFVGSGASVSRHGKSTFVFFVTSSFLSCSSHEPGRFAAGVVSFIFLGDTSHGQWWTGVGLVVDFHSFGDDVNHHGHRRLGNVDFVVNGRLVDDCFLQNQSHQFGVMDDGADVVMRCVGHQSHVRVVRCVVLTVVVGAGVGTYLGDSSPPHELERTLTSEHA